MTKEIASVIEQTTFEKVPSPFNYSDIRKFLSVYMNVDDVVIDEMWEVSLDATWSVPCEVINFEGLRRYIDYNLDNSWKYELWAALACLEEKIDKSEILVIYDVIACRFVQPN